MTKERKRHMKTDPATHLGAPKPRAEAALAAPKPVASHFWRSTLGFRLSTLLIPQLSAVNRAVPQLTPRYPQFAIFRRSTLCAYPCRSATSVVRTPPTTGFGCTTNSTSASPYSTSLNRIYTALHQTTPSYTEKFFPYLQPSMYPRSACSLLPPRPPVPPSSAAKGANNSTKFDLSSTKFD